MIVPVALVMLGVLLALVGGAAAAATAVPLGTADSFGVLAGTGITNTGPTTVNGDIGTYPTTTFTGSASVTETGTNHGGDAVTQGAKTDLVTAYNTAAGEGPTTPITADLAGQTLVPGVYNSGSSIGLNGALTLNGGGDPNAVFVFQAGSTLTTGSASSITLINGAQSCNIFWQVGSSATLGTGSTFRGTVIALDSITVTTSVTIDGRVLARDGAVTLDTDTITKPTCTTPTPTTTTSTTATTTTTPTPTPTPTPADTAGASVTAATLATSTAATTTANLAAAAEAAENVAVAAQTTALRAANAANVAVARAAAARAGVAAERAERAAAAARRLAAATKATAVKAAAARAVAAAKAARLAATKAVVFARVAKTKAAVSTHPVAKPAVTSSGFTG